MKAEMTSSSHPRLIKLTEVADRLSVCSRSVRRLIAKGELSVVKVGRCTRMFESVVDAYLDRLGHTGTHSEGHHENVCL